ncbi:hypothetical protein DPMN_074459 [Dreissena polymorpha]|uniref:MADF domain-containing protein n=1 Tax=Dreissena polymorpha TaxID=45954 RepID=A0A9D3YIN6_DREPO|nr:hypothetical protein DPMN_074459 [Dreissena polymorpha]
MKGRLSSIDISEKKINVARDHPEIYNQRIKEYKDKEIASNIWKSIANEMSIDGVSGK